MTDDPDRWAEFLSRGAMAAAADLGTKTTGLRAGTRIGPYEVTSVLGIGGMGEVYRAHDERLGRDVAIKVLPAIVTADPDRLSRFDREARILASLNHPNIAAIYGVETAGTSRALVLELVEGETLAHRIATGPMPIAEAMTIARQVIDALDAAHEKGIIHRDLKPANIKITPGGRVKVLDFGLAKSLLVASPVSAAESVTASAHTVEGAVLGTSAYMSPEQARGLGVDKRTDIWAFGCVFYEMLTRRAPFARETVTDTLAAVIEREPDWDALPKSIPATVRTLLGRCLTKSLEHRLRDIADARYDLDHVTVGDASPRTKNRRPAVVVVLAVGLVAVLIAAGAWLRAITRVQTAPQVTRLSIPLASDDTFNAEGQPHIAISPDGRSVVYAINQRLYERRLDQLDAQPIAGTEPPPSLGPGRGANWAVNPFFSPDGQWVGFHEAGGLKKVPVAGGAAVTLSAEADPIGPAKWYSNDTILFATPASEGVGGIWRISASGGTPQRIVSVKPGEWALSPQLLPGGADVLFTLSRGNAADDADVVVQSLATGERHIVLHGGHSARYLNTGHLIYGHNGTLFAVRYDRVAYRTIGAPIQVVADVAQEIAAGAWGGLEYDVSDDGTLVYLPESAVRLRRVLEWVDRDGHSQPLDMEARAYEYPRISPDGRRVLLDLRDQENDAWVWEFDRRTLTRVTFERHSGGPVIWTPDGSRTIFAPSRDGILNLFWKPISGGSEERLLTSSNTQYADAVTPDGRRVLFEEVDPKTKFDIRIFALDGPHVQTPVVQSPFNDQNPALSSDGSWLAYQSDESGRAEIYVSAFHDAASGRWQVSTAGGTRPLWSRDGRELFYLDVDRRLTVVPVQTKPAFRAGTPHALFDTKPFGLEGVNRNFDISLDGSRFLFVRNLPIPPDAKRFIVVQHWDQELTRLVPVH